MVVEGNLMTERMHRFDQALRLVLPGAVLPPAVGSRRKCPNYRCHGAHEDKKEKERGVHPGLSAGLGRLNPLGPWPLLPVLVGEGL